MRSSMCKAQCSEVPDDPTKTPARLNLSHMLHVGHSVALLGLGPVSFGTLYVHPRHTVHAMLLNCTYASNTESKPALSRSTICRLALCSLCHLICFCPSISRTHQHLISACCFVMPNRQVWTLLALLLKRMLVDYWYLIGPCSFGAEAVNGAAA